MGKFNLNSEFVFRTGVVVAIGSTIPVIGGFINTVDALGGVGVGAIVAGVGWIMGLFGK